METMSGLELIKTHGPSVNPFYAFIMSFGLEDDS